MKKLWLGTGAVVGATLLSISTGGLSRRNVASVESPRGVDPREELSEIRVSRESVPPFDGEIRALSQQEGRYRERGLRLRTVRSRAQAKKIRPATTSKRARSGRG